MNGKLTVLAAVAELQGKAFRNVAIVEITGLSKQLVNHHLNKLVDTGLVEKEGPIYVCVDTPALIQLIAIGGNANQEKMPFETVILPKTQVDKLNRLVLTMNTARAFNWPENREMRTGVINDIDDTIRSLKIARKLITNPVRSRRYYRFKWPHTVDQMVNVYHEYLGMFTSSVLRKSQIEVAIGEDWDEHYDE